MERKRRGGNKEKAILLFYEPRVLFFLQPPCNLHFPLRTYAVQHARIRSRDATFVR